MAYYIAVMDLYIGCSQEDSARFKKLAAERGLSSFMNDTKWRELCLAIMQLPFPPFYQAKTLFEAAPPPLISLAKLDSWGDWAKTHESSLGIHIEWVRIYPIFVKSRGRYAKPEVFECVEQLRFILDDLNLPYVEKDQVFTVYGHANGVEFITRSFSSD